jgi:hypothetical protein
MEFLQRLWLPLRKRTRFRLSALIAMLLLVLVLSLGNAPAHAGDPEGKLYASLATWRGLADDSRPPRQVNTW